MLKSELFEIIANGESSTVDFKRDDCRSEQLAKEIVAMANHSGGRILLGVEDDGKISGVHKDDLEDWVMDVVISRKVHPQILPSYQEVLIDEGKRVAILSFTQGSAKPYVLRHNGREEIFVRVGSASRLDSREQRGHLFGSGGILHTETLPVSGTSIRSLDMARIREYLDDILQDLEIPSSDDRWVQRLLDLEFLTNGVGDTPVCTIAGLLLFGHKPRRRLRQAGIRLMVFDGVEKDYQSLLDEVLDLPMVALWHRDESGRRTLISNGIVESAIQMLKPFLTEEGNEINESMRRERVWHYPIEAVREVIVNAIAHRNWTQFLDIEITCYSNRIEVISPGAMHNSMSVEKMKAGRRMPRNVLIVEILKDYGYVDARGMGVRTKVTPLMNSMNGIDPEFEATDDYLKTVLYRKM